MPVALRGVSDLARAPNQVLGYLAPGHTGGGAWKHQARSFVLKSVQRTSYKRDVLACGPALRRPCCPSTAYTRLSWQLLLRHFLQGKCSPARCLRPRPRPEPRPDSCLHCWVASDHPRRCACEVLMKGLPWQSPAKVLTPSPSIASRGTRTLATSPTGGGVAPCACSPARCLRPRPRPEPGPRLPRAWAHWGWRLETPG